MAQSRLLLHDILEEVLGSSNVYFQPPASVSLKYPCILYSRETAETEFADNNPYSYTKAYSVTVIDPDPDSVIPDKVARLPMCRHSRFFTADQLNHDVFNIFF